MYVGKTLSFDQVNCLVVVFYYKLGPDRLTGTRSVPGPASGAAPRIGRPWLDPVAELALSTLEKPHPLAGPVTLAAFARHYGFHISLMP